MKTSAWIAAVGLVSAFLAPLPAAAGGPDTGGVLIADGGFGGVLDIREHTVHVTVHNGIAVTRVDQVFLNTEDRIVEALYIFPVPRGASVANFSMWINGVEMVGEVLEKQRAREIYESYKRRGVDPGLLEQKDYKTFEMRIFPIGAGAEQKVSLTYYQEMSFDHDWATYVYPLATSPRPGLVQETTGKFSISFDVLSDVPIVKMESPSHADDFVVADHSEKYFQASLEATGGDLSRDVVLAYAIERPRTGVDVIASRPEEEDGYFLLTLMAGPELEQAARGTDYVFILDASGSMAHDGKLGLSRRSIDAFVRALEPEDRFEVITFNVRPTTLFDGLTAATEEARVTAEEFLASRRARGGTRLRPAIATAYKYGDPDRTLNVVILSDGMTEQQERGELMELIRARPKNARVFCVGVGNEVERPLLQRVADDAGGFAAFLSQQDDFERQAAAFRRKVARPAATDVQLSFAGVEVYDLEPRTLPNLYHGMPLQVYGRYRGGGEVDVALSATVEGRDFERTFEVELPSKKAGNPRIERMWAWHRIQRLRHVAPRPVDEIVRLGEAYSIATEWTSFIVLENDAEYRRWKIERSNALRIERDRRQSTGLRRRLASIRDKAQSGLGPEAVAKPAPREETASTRVRPPAGNPVVPPPRPSAPEPRDSNRRSSGGGGGAVDPLSGGIAASLAALALLSRRRRRREDDRG